MFGIGVYRVIWGFGVQGFSVERLCRLEIFEGFGFYVFERRVLGVGVQV